jgi:phosphoribosylcarboxyaminoimidazole (NCAIR) mutase
VVGLKSNGLTGWTLKDLSIITVAASGVTTSNRGKSNYGVWIYNSTNYNIIRCYVSVGAATNGIAGGNATAGGNGGNGNTGGTGGCASGNDTGGAGGSAGTAGAVGTGPAGNGTAGGNGGNGGKGGDDNGGQTSGLAGTNGAAGSGGAAGGSTGGTGGTGSSGAAGAAGGNGAAGTAGTNGSTTAATYTNGYYVPSYGTNGTAGFGGGGGKGGGGGSWYDTFVCCDDAGAGGSGGAGGGGGGGAATGGTGGGSRFGVLVVGTSSGGTILDCSISTNSGIAAIGGAGGNGGAGGTGGTGPNGVSNCDQGGAGGKGGNGANGGAGGSGGAGGNGVRYAIAVQGGATSPTITTSPAITVNSSISGGTVPFTTFTANYLRGCTNSDIVITRSAAISSLNGGLLVNNITNSTTTYALTGTANLSAYYTTTGNKDITIGATTLQDYVIIHTNRTPPVIDPIASPICSGTSINLSCQPNSPSTSTAFEWDIQATNPPITGVNTNPVPIYESSLEDPGVVTLPTVSNCPTVTYQIRLRVKDQCCGWSIPVYTTVTVEPPLANNTISTDQNFCTSGDPANLVGSLPTGGNCSSYTYQWQLNTGSGFANIVGATSQSYNPPLISTVGQYQYQRIVTSGMCGASTSNIVTVNVYSAPTVSISPDPATVCQGQNLLLNGNPVPGSGAITTYAWTGTGASYLNTTNAQDVTFNGTTAPIGGSPYNLTYTITDANNCTATDNLTVTVAPLPVITNPPTNTTICSGQTASYNPTASITATFIYESVATGAVSGNSGATSAVIGNISDVLTNTGTTNETVTYTIYAGTALGCASVPITWVVTVTPAPQAPSIPTVDRNNFCADDAGNISLSTTGGVGQTVQWFSGSCGGTSAGTGNPLVIASPTTTTTYYVRYVDACSNATTCQSVIVTVNPNPTPTIVAPTSICSSTNLTLSTSIPYSSYTWSNSGGTAATATYNNVTAATTYTVTVSDVNSCTATDTHAVTINPLPTPAFNTPTTTVCANATGVTYTLSSTYSSYNWSISGGSITAGGGATNNSATVTWGSGASGTISVTVTDGNACVGTATANVTINPLPILALTNNTPNACNGQITNITYSTNIGTIAWTSTATGTASSSPASATPGTASGTIAATANAGASGGTLTYTVIATAATGCTATANATVTTLILPTATLTSANNLNCTNTSSILTAGGGTSYNFGSGFSATNTSTISTPNTYTVTVTAANGCTDTESVSVTQNIVLPTASIAPTANNNCTAPYNGALTLTSDGSTFAWSNSEITQNLTATNAGTYTVTVTAANGCTATSNGTITNTLILPTASIAPTANNNCTTPYNGALTLTSDGSTFAWSNSETTQNLTATNAGTYTVTVTAANGCSTVASSTIANTPILPTASIAPTANNNCTAPYNGALTLTSDGSTFAWSNSETTQNLTATNAGTYTVTVTGANGCTATSSGTISNIPTLPTASIAPTANNNCTAPYNGALTLTSDGSTFAWSNSETTQNLTATNAGTYTVTVTGANGCTATSSGTISNIPTLPTASIAPTANNNCTAPYNGALTLTSDGSTFAWSNSETTQNLTATNAGTYTVTVTAANGCTATSSGTIANIPTLPTASIAPTANNNCTAPYNGALTLTSDGSTFAWSNSETTQNLTATNAGTYTVTVTAANGCTATSSGTIANTPTLPTASIAPTANNNCTAPYNGALTLTSDGSTFAWSNSETTQNLTATNAGTYTVTVTGANGCSTVASGTIANTPTLPTASITPTANNNCTAPYNGALTLTSDGSTFAWSNSETTQNLTATNAGTYTVTVTGANGCTATSSGTISNTPTLPTASITPTANNNCTAPYNGALTLTSNGSTFAWSNSETTQNLTATNAGTYTVTVTGANGCSTVASGTIANTPTLPIVTLSTPTDNTNCVAPYNGSLSVTAPTGVGVGYLWTGGSTNATLSAANAGTYTVTVTAANGCTATSSDTISNTPTLPTASIAPTANNNCTAPYNGALTLTSNGSTFAWSNSETTQNLTATNAGTYTVTVTGANGCSTVASGTISNTPILPTASIAPTANNNCTAPYNGALTLTSNGSTFAWSNSETTQNLTATNAGTYTVTVTGANGCSTVASGTIANTPTLPIVTLSTPTDNNNCVAPYNGSLSVTTPTGVGVGYLWTGGSTNATLSAANGGTYSVTVTAANGCTATSSGTIANIPTLPTASIAPTANNNCTAPYNGALTLSSDGSTFAWSNSETTQNLTATNAGTYTVTVTGANGCSTVASSTIANIPTLPTASIAPTANNNCTAPYNGALTLTSDGSTFAWSNSETTQNLTATNAGTYTVTVTGANGCSTVASGTITNTPILPTASIAPTANNNCTAPYNGALTLTSDGSTFAWSNSETTQNLTATNAGTYTVTVTGANGCTATSSGTIANIPTLPIVTLSTPTDNTNCVAPYNGSLSVTAPTGVGVGYLWTGGSTNATLSAANGGTYSVTVTAANGCTATSSGTIADSFALPTATLSSANNLDCTNTSSILTAGGGISYNFGSGFSATNTSSINTPNTYTVTVTAANGCTDTETVNVTQNITPPVATLSSANNLDCTNTSSVLTAGGGISYNFGSGFSPTNTSTISTPNTYTVTVTNASGCTDTESVSVTVNNSPTATITGTNTYCVGDAASPLTATGGSTYLWDNGTASASITPTTNTAGNTTYTVTVTNASGCTDTESVSVTVNASPTASISGTTTYCVGDAASSLTASGGGTYLWDNGTAGASITPSTTTAGNTTYTVTVTTANGCTDTESVSVTVNASPTASISGTTTYCVGDAASTLTATGGSTYLWDNGTASASITPTTNTAGNTTYTVTVTNASGCTDTESVSITINTSPTATITGTNTYCLGDAASSLTASGGSTYLWNNGTAGAIITPTTNTAGNTTYTVTVTNASGCTDTESVSITINTSPTATITGTDIYCLGDVASSLTATGGGTYLWDNGTAGSSITPSTTTAGATIYTVTVTNAGGCTDTESASVTVNASPTASISGTTTYCVGDAASTLTATGGSTYLWDNGTAGAIITPTTNTAGNTTYTVTVTNASGCTDTESVSITINTSPTASISGTTTYCVGDAASTLTATGGSTYLWDNGTASASITPTTNTAGNTTYTVTVTNASGCTDTESISVTVNNSPTATITGTDTYCLGDAASTLTASGGSTYLWDNGIASASMTPTTNTAGSTTYTVTVTNASGCTDIETVSVTINNCGCNNPASASITPVSGSVCGTNPQTFAITLSGGATSATISSDGSGSLSVTNISASGDVIYTPSATDFGNTITITITTNDPDGAGILCNSFTTTASVTINTSPTATIIGTTTYCVGDAASNLTASGGGTYLWDNGTAGASITASTTTAGSTTYTVTVTNASGCTDTESVGVTVSNCGCNNPASASITPVSGSVCGTNPQTLSITLSGGATSATISSDGSGSLSVTNISASGDVIYTPSATDFGNTITITIVTNDPDGAGVLCNSFTTVASLVVGALPTATITGTDTYCLGDVASSLTASGGGTYLWDNGTAGSSITPSTNTSGNTTYTVTVTNASGCTDTESVSITINTSPTASISGTTTYCVGDAAGSLTASGGGTYLWDNGTAGASITASTTTAGSTTYTVTVTNASGCTDTESVGVTVSNCGCNNPASASITPASGSVCGTNPQTLSITLSGGATSATISSDGSGSLSVTNISASGDVIYTPSAADLGNTITLTIITNDPDGAGVLCNSFTTVASLVVGALPTATITGTDTYCVGDAASSLTASGGGTYLWDNGTAGAIITASTTTAGNTTYTVTVTNDCQWLYGYGKCEYNNQYITHREHQWHHYLLCGRCGG